MGRDRGIEGIRGVAACGVMIGHLALVLLLTTGTADTVGQRLAGEAVALLFHGVTVFFVLSGYLLYRPFAAHLLGGREPSVRGFYRNRALRILPAYWFILLVAGFVLGSVKVPGGESPSGNDAFSIGYLTDPLQLLTNLTLTQGYAAGPRFEDAIGPAWSLVPEIAFYAVLPGLWLLGRRLAGGRPSTRAALLPALLLIAVGTVGHVVSLALVQAHGVGVVSETWPSELHHSLLATCQLFGFGMVVAVLRERLADGPGQLSATRLRGWALVSLAGALAAYLPSRLLGVDRLDVGVAAAALVLLTVVPYGGVVRRSWVTLLESPPLRRAGVISYSIYLWHLPVALFMLREWPGLGYTTLGGFLVSTAAIVPVVLLLSELSYRFVEKPALDRKRRTVPLDGWRPPAPRSSGSDRIPACLLPSSPESPARTVPTSRSSSSRRVTTSTD